MRHPKIDISKRATDTFNTFKTAAQYCEKKPVLKTLIELGYFPEEDAYNNLIFLVNSAQTLLLSFSPKETEQAMVNLKVVMLLLDAITYKSDQLLDLKIMAVKLLSMVHR